MLRSVQRDVVEIDMRVVFDIFGVFVAPRFGFGPPHCFEVDMFLSKHDMGKADRACETDIQCTTGRIVK